MQTRPLSRGQRRLFQVVNMYMVMDVLPRIQTAGDGGSAPSDGLVSESSEVLFLGALSGFTVLQVSEPRVQGLGRDLPEHRRRRSRRIGRLFHTLSNALNNRQNLQQNSAQRPGCNCRFAYIAGTVGNPPSSPRRRPRFWVYIDRSQGSL